MKKYNNEIFTTYERYSERFKNKYEATFNKPIKYSIAEELNKQKVFSQNILNEKVRHMLEEQRNIMLRNLPPVNIFKQQEATLSPIASMLKKQRLSMSASLAPALRGLGKLNTHKIAVGLVGEELKLQSILHQNDFFLR